MDYFSDVEIISLYFNLTVFKSDDFLRIYRNFKLSSHPRKCYLMIWNVPYMVKGNWHQKYTEYLIVFQASLLSTYLCET